MRTAHSLRGGWAGGWVCGCHVQCCFVPNAAVPCTTLFKIMQTGVTGQRLPCYHPFKRMQIGSVDTAPPLQPPFRRTQSSDSAAQTVSPLPLAEAAAMPRSAKRRSFVISLDAPPEVRWREVLRAFKPQITAMLLASEDLQAFDNLGPSARFACRKLLLALPEEQRREVGSAAEELGVDLHVAAASQVLYD